MKIRTVYFDCDSTLSAIEGIDELGRFSDKKLATKLAKLTTKAMQGDLPLAEVYPQRLELLAPTAMQVGSLGESYIASLVPEATEVIIALGHLGKQVGIISGAIKQAVLPLAQHLGIPAERVHAVELSFGEDGSYEGFDRDSPLWQNGGKKTLLEGLPSKQKPICLVGDGITDLEAAEAVELFVGFGGVVRRKEVVSAAKHFLPGPGLGRLLEIILDEQELACLREQPVFAALLQS